MNPVNWLAKKMLASTIRKALTILATLALAHGWLEQSDMSPVLAKIIEASPLIADFAWSWWEKHGDTKLLGVAVTASGSTVQRLKAEAKATPLSQVT